MPGYRAARLFVEGAAPIGLVPGDNLPFALRGPGKTMQSMVISPTVSRSSRCIPVEIGANQVPIPIGDGTHRVLRSLRVHAEGPVAPMISIANSSVCTDWDPTVEFEVGKVDNDVIQADDANGQRRGRMRTRQQTTVSTTTTVSTSAS